MKPHHSGGVEGSESWTNPGEYPWDCQMMAFFKGGTRWRQWWCRRKKSPEQLFSSLELTVSLQET